MSRKEKSATSDTSPKVSDTDVHQRPARPVRRQRGNEGIVTPPGNVTFRGSVGIVTCEVAHVRNAFATFALALPKPLALRRNTVKAPAFVRASDASS